MSWHVTTPIQGGPTAAWSVAAVSKCRHSLTHLLSLNPAIHLRSYIV
jgi:hypothetical protein